jgi:hypothetical protein
MGRLIRYHPINSNSYVTVVSPQTQSCNIIKLTKQQTGEYKVICSELVSVCVYNHVYTSFEIQENTNK